MVIAVIQNGRIEARDPIPSSWEGQLVTVAPLSPDDEIPDLEERIAALHAMGPMEYEPGEQEMIASSLAELKQVSKSAMEALAGINSLGSPRISVPSISFIF